MIAAGSDSGGTAPADTAYTLVAAARITRPSSDNNVQEVVQVTARSHLYLVTYTWFVETASWTADGANPIIALKTSEVNAVCGYDHVIGFRTVQDYDQSRLLVNYAVITVGTDDGSIQDENGPTYHPVRMDQLDGTAPFAAADAIWHTLSAAAGG